MSDIQVRQQQDILWLILTHPPQNTLTSEMLLSCAKAIRDAAERAPRLIVLTGAGDQYFCGGADNMGDRAAAGELMAVLEEARAWGATVVGLVKGIACGVGSELVLLCDVVIAHEGATFRFTEPASAFLPDVLTVVLPKLVGQEEARRLWQEEITLAAREARRLGIVHQLIPALHFVQDVEELLVMLATVGAA